MNGLKPIKKLKKFPFDLSGSQPPEESFRLCTQAGKCITLKNGRLYPCSTAAYADLFDRYFGEHFDYSEQDYVDIYKTADSAGILHRLSRPIPFCRYCGIPNIQRGLRWEISKKEKSEWM